PGPVTALRFDIDCLAIEETKDENHLPNREGFASTRPGLSHACGHDGHTAVGLGVAQWLADNKETLCGKVKLVFQPAEEGVRGAAAIAASGVLDDVDWFTAGHIGCDAKPGQVGVSHEGYLATTKFDLEIFGLPCAAGSPEKGHSALMCACNTVMALGSLPGHSKGITRVQVGKIVSGTARNIVAGHAYVVLEVRGESTEINDYMAPTSRRPSRASPQPTSARTSSPAWARP
ncbi:MAG: amidohydrolase, partial [Sutterella wadsworthensis]